MANQKNESTNDTALKGSAPSVTTAPQAGRDFNATDALAQTADSLKAEAADKLEEVKETAQNFLDQAKATAGEAYNSVAEKAATTIEEHKSGLTGDLTSVANAVREVSGSLKEGDGAALSGYAAKYSETAAQKIEGVANYFDSTDLKGMARDVEAYARRNPAVFLGTAFALGILAARFFKSSPPDAGRQATTGDNRQPSDRSAVPKSTGASASAN